MMIFKNKYSFQIKIKNKFKQNQINWKVNKLNQFNNFKEKKNVINNYKKFNQNFQNKNMN